MTDLLTKSRSFWLIEKCESTLEESRALLRNAPVLSPPDTEKPFTLHVDASNVCVWNILSRECHGVLHPVAYFSHRLNCHHVSYSTIPKDALTSVLSSEHSSA